MGVMLLRKMGWREGRAMETVHCVDIVAKNDLRGLGFDPLREIAQFDEVREMRQAATKKKTSYAFGGEVDGDDDEVEVFEVEDMSRYDIQIERIKKR
jgi:hypothetical protein